MNSGSIVLPPLSALYGAVVRARLGAYRRGVLSATRLTVPVISVGNITVGGTGKTPLVEFFCRALAREGRKVCVLTRGYKREQPENRVLVSDGNTVHATVTEAGDEAFLLAQTLKGVAAVISDSKRAAAGNWAVQELGSDVFVLDDGYQHLQLARDLNLLIIDASDPWGGNRLLPTGRLREPLSGISRADCIVVTRADNPDNTISLIAQLRKRASCSIFTSRMRKTGVRTLDANRVDDAVFGQSLSAFCGVGNPKSFYEQLRRSGFKLRSTHSFPDHHKYQQRDIDEICAKAVSERVTGLITTAKDAVKLQSLQFDLPCYVFEIECAIDEEASLLALMREALTGSVNRE